MTDYKEEAKKYFLLGAKIADETSKTNHIAKDFETHFELIFQPELKAVKTAEIDRLAHDVLNYFFDGDWADLDKEEIKKLINGFIDRIANQFSQPKERKCMECGKEIIGVGYCSKECAQHKEEVERLSDLLKQEGLG